MSGLDVDIRMLRATGPGMSLLDAVEYTTPDPNAGLLSMDAASSAMDLALLERRAKAEGFQV
jgi:hypothetical protein